MKSVGIIGLGRFGKILANILQKGYSISAYDLNDISPITNINFYNLDKVLQERVIFIAVPIRNFESLIKKISPKLKSGTTLIDVCSVKSYPVNVMLKNINKDIGIISTHPMFGPDSFSTNTKLKMMMHKVRDPENQYISWRNYFSNQGIDIIEMSPDDHDRLAARSQGITHFLGRMLKQFGIKKTQIDTQGFKDLLDLVEQTCNDTWDLYTDLQLYNPYTLDVIAELLRSAESLDKQLREIKNVEKNSWKNYEALHIPNYEDPEKLDSVLSTLKGFPPLVFAGEVRSLRKSLSQVAEGHAFLLQGGDCAESFSEFHADNIRDTFRVILQMAVILTSGTNLPIIKVGRMAGQFAKPRSSPTEVKDDQEYESYRGDIINSIEFDKSLRKPDPERMLKAYSQAASTLNLLRAFADGGYADLRYVNSWNMGFLKSGPEYERYRKLANKIQESLNFMEALGVNSDNTIQLRKTEYYTCHEALLLPYEESLTREDSTTGDIYDTSAHFVWIGDRTRFHDSAHVEFCKGIQNPIGIKCGPTLDHDDLIKILDKLNPENSPGRITLISRYGSETVQDHLPRLIKRISDEGRTVVWSCDPMHGNTVKSSDGTKTRPFENILNEVKNNIKIHNSQGSWFGGIHLEMTGQNVTECTGGIDDISESDLKDRYHTHCDPRLNANQAIQLAFLIADELKNNAS